MSWIERNPKKVSIAQSGISISELLVLEVTFLAWSGNPLLQTMRLTGLNLLENSNFFSSPPCDLV